MALPHAQLHFDDFVLLGKPQKKKNAQHKEKRANRNCEMFRMARE